MSFLLDSLNERQLEAVTHFTGPLMVIAGAGSGKTKALTHRIAYLIKEKGVSPQNILSVTFTNKAAGEMKDRVIKLIGSSEYGHSTPTMGTFHSLCVSILRSNIHLLDFENSFAIYDAADQQILMKNIMESRSIDPKRINPKAVLSHISQAKNQLINANSYGQFANDYFSEKVSELYPLYQENLERNNALDFDDLIMRTVEIFKKYPEVLKKYQEKFKFISVDEYQDTNHAQYVLVSLLAEKYKNLCVIGDADQSIYSWRGATIANILEFEKDYPDAKVVFLEQNYRSTQLILDAAHDVISKNVQRQDKKMWTEKQEGEKIKHWLADHERHEAEMVSNEIINQIRGSEVPNYKDFVVLYRTNAQSRVVEEVFLRYGIPYRIIGGIKFYERKEIKDVLAYLRVLNNPHDSVSLLRIINSPTRKIGSKTLDTIRDFSIRHRLSFFNALLLADEIEGLSGSKAEAVNKFVKLIKDLQKKNEEEKASAMIKYVINESGYKSMVDDGSVEGEARMENIQELISVAHKYDSLEGGLSLRIFLEEVSLIADIDNMDEQENSVTLMTIHSAKGLEFPNVFITGLEEGIFPHSRSILDQMELEEERRLLYVAMTRAKDKLYLIHARQRMLYGEAKSNAPSQFLNDISDEYMEANFGNRSVIRSHVSISDIGERPIPVENDKLVIEELATGDRVRHNVFGNGIVVNVTGGVVTVAFEDVRVGIKKLALSVAPLEKI